MNDFDCLLSGVLKLKAAKILLLALLLVLTYKVGHRFGRQHDEWDVERQIRAAFDEGREAGPEHTISDDQIHVRLEAYYKSGHEDGLIEGQAKGWEDGYNVGLEDGKKRRAATEATP